ncbi:6-bladed beta-propeller [Candidatus Aminicenantes bacterium AC-708-I09]|jgi:hypothetical protein|nr:6-bladed beta-propeller [Candidatus Aminicenantes bacterium AC-708-I09]
MMKKIKIFVLFLIIISFFFTCKKGWQGKIYTENGVEVIENTGEGLWGRKINEKIKFVETLSLGKEEGEDYLMFHRFIRVAVDSDLNIYVLDAMNHRLLKFDKNGNFIWKAGRKGQGPGEFQYPSGIGISSAGEVAVIDERSIIFFNDKGEYQRTIKLDKSMRNIQFLPDERLMINIFVLGQPGVAAEFFSKDGEFLSKFPDEYRYGPKLSPRVGVSIVDSGFKFFNNKIYLSIPDKYEIREYDLKGNLLRKIRRNVKLKPPNIKLTAGGRGVSVFPSDSSGPCFLYKEKFLINKLTLVEKKGKDYESKSFLDFFNEKGQFLGSYPLPKNTYIQTIDHLGNFYFVKYEPYPQVIRVTPEIH